MSLVTGLVTTAVYMCPTYLLCDRQVGQRCAAPGTNKIPATKDSGTIGVTQAACETSSDAAACPQSPRQTQDTWPVLIQGPGSFRYTCVGRHRSRRCVASELLAARTAPGWNATCTMLHVVHVRFVGPRFVPTVC